MPLATYTKTIKNSAASEPRPRRTLSVVSTGLVVMGSLLVGSVAGPIAGYLLFTAPGLRQTIVLRSPLASPQSRRGIGTEAGLAQAPSTSGTVLSAQALASQPQSLGELDFRRVENWFPGAVKPPTVSSKITHYNLSIPALKIENATVTIGGGDLFESLIHYQGTANPGELGAPVIFGHSILRQFYNPKSYMAIFSTLMTLQNGDDITINYDGVKYIYRVIDKLEVKPTDVAILEQRYDGKYLKLITCVPEGTKLRRGVIVAELVN